MKLVNTTLTKKTKNKYLLEIIIELKNGNQLTFNDTLDETKLSKA